MTDPSVATLTLTLLQVLVGIGVIALLVGIVAVGTLLTPAPAVQTSRPAAHARFRPGLPRPTDLRTVRRPGSRTVRETPSRPPADVRPTSGLAA